MGTAVDRASAVPRMIDKAKGYDMPAKQVNGMDVVEVYEATQEALKAIRNGEGPQFLEMLTYRFEGHSMGDPLRYRTKDEVEKWQEDDPIGILERRILKEGAATQEELEGIDKAVEKEMEEAVQFAEESPFPDYEELFTEIYVAD